MGDNLLAIRNALAVIGATTTNEETKSNVIPTSKTRGAIDLLASSTAEELLENRVNLREVAESLFNWGGTPKVTKNVIRSLNAALNTPGKYSHAVELTAFLAALAPSLEPDRIARLFSAVNEVETAFAPAKYTLQLSHKLKKLFDLYNEERKEKLAYSLWVESHTGRWWDLTAGQQTQNRNDDEAEAPEDDETIPEDELLRLFSEMKLTWTPAVAEQFSRIPDNEIIRDTLDRYNDALLKEKLVDPDVALLASHIKWLTPNERPESPVGNLVETLTSIAEEIDYKFPEKPKTFSALFPDVKLYGGTQFPFPNSVLMADGKPLTRSTRLEVVKNATELAENRTYMGNCTWSYKSRMEKGEYVLFRIHDGERIYNASMIISGNRWNVGEVNSRFNRGQVPNDVRVAFSKLVEKFVVKADNELTKNIENYKKLQNLKNRKYRYKL